MTSLVACLYVGNLNVFSNSLKSIYVSKIVSYASDAVKCQLVLC